MTGSQGRFRSCAMAAPLIVALAAHLTAAEQTPADTVGPRPDGGATTPVNQLVTPIGVQVELDGMRPQSLALSPDGRVLVSAGKAHELVVVDPESGAVRARVRPAADGVTEPPPADTPDRNLNPDKQALGSFTGLAFSPDGRRLYMSNVHGSVKVFSVTDGEVAPSHAMPLPPARAPARAAEIPSGIAVAADATRVYVCGNLSNRLLEIDAATGRTTRTFDVGVAPYDVVLVGGTAVVSNWGGRRPGPGDLAAAAGKGTTVRVDPVRHVASEGLSASSTWRLAPCGRWSRACTPRRSPQRPTAGTWPAPTRRPTRSRSST